MILFSFLSKTLLSVSLSSPKLSNKQSLQFPANMTRPSSYCYVLCQIVCYRLFSLSISIVSLACVFSSWYCMHWCWHGPCLTVDMCIVITYCVMVHRFIILSIYAWSSGLLGFIYCCVSIYQFIASFGCLWCTCLCCLFLRYSSVGIGAGFGCLFVFVITHPIFVTCTL